MQLRNLALGGPGAQLTTILMSGVAYFRTAAAVPLIKRPGADSVEPAVAIGERITTGNSTRTD